MCTTLLIGDSSDSELDKYEDLLQLSQQGDEVFRVPCAMTMVEVDVTCIDKDEVTEAAPAPKQLEDEGQVSIDDLI